MRSTDHNLNNPMSVDQIILEYTASALKMMNAVHIDRSLYDQITTKDPHTMYIVHDNGEDLVYLGDNRIPDSCMSWPTYLIAPTYDNEWAVCSNLKSSWTAHDEIVEICRYKDLDKAADAVRLYIRAGHEDIEISIYRMLISYIKKDIGINDLIINIIGLHGFNNSPKLQELIQTAYSYGVMENQIDPQSKNRGYGKYQMDLPVLLRNEIGRLANAYPTSLYPYYSKLYDVIIKYCFFKGTEYQTDPDNANLRDVISDIREVFSMPSV